MLHADGFDKMFDAFLDLFTEKHFGKAVIKAYRVLEVVM